MSRYIDADKLIHRAIHGDGDGYGMWCCTCESTEDFIDYIEEAPTADVTPVVHAHWEIVEPWCEGPVWFKCSNCEEPYIFEEDEKYKYCPNCGAFMGEEAG